MRYSKILFFFLIITLITFSACKEDEFSEEIQEVENIEPQVTTNNNLVYRMSSGSNSTEGLNLGCFTITYPFVLIVDGIAVSIDGEDDFISLDTAAAFIDFQYPLNIITLEGEASVVENGQQLGEAFASCIPDTGWEQDGFPAFLINDFDYCYELVFPIDLVDSEGTVFSADSEETFVDLLVDNPALFFQFPITLSGESDSLTSVANDQELFNLLWSCDPYINPIDTSFSGIGQLGCYEIQFPITLIDQNGGTVSIADENELINNLFSGDFINFGYPINLINEEGEVIEVNNEEELNTAFEDCGIVIDYNSDLLTFLTNSSILGGDCYDLVYPFSGYAGTEEITFANEQDVLDYLANITNFYLIEFPISVVVISTGETIVLENEEDYNNLLEDCQ